MRSVQLRPRTVALLCAYALALHALLGVAVWKSNFLHLAQKTLGLAPPEERELRLYRAMLAWSELDRSVPDGAVVVLRDSMLQNLDPLQLGGEEQVGQLGLPVRAPAAVAPVLPVEVVQRDQAASVSA